MTGGRKKVWGEEDKEVKGQKQKTWKPLKKWVKSRDESDKAALREEKRKLKEVRKEKREESEKRKWEKIEKSKTKAEFWEGVNKYKKKRKKTSGSIPKQEWLRHFKKLLGEEKRDKRTEQSRREKQEEGEKQGGGEEKDELKKDIAKRETEKDLGKMKKGKAAGEDGIVMEFLKYLPGKWIEEIAGIMNGMFKGGDLIKGWEVARIYPIFKEEDEREVKNYRG